jgi:site-specific DNA-cytosine methylase
MPLTGGLAIGAANALGCLPEVIVDMFDEAGNVFGNAHSSSLRSYWPKVPYNVANTGKFPHVDITHAVPPCGGLSSATTWKSDDNPINEWIIRTAKRAITAFSPQVHVFENAPGLSTESGRWMAKRVAEFAKSLGYSLTMVKVNTANHGIPQKRRRTYALLWKGMPRVIALETRGRPLPVSEFLAERYIVARPHAEEFLNSNYANDSLIRYARRKGWINSKNVSIGGGPNAKSYVISLAVKKGLLPELIAWLADESVRSRVKGGDEYRANAKQWNDIVIKVKAKTDRGLGFRRETPVLVRDLTPTLMIHGMRWWKHPTEPRFMSVRECMDLMGLPDDFRLSYGEGAKPAHVTQNVPVNTSEDLVQAVAEALAQVARPSDARISNVIYDDDNMIIQDFSRLEWLREEV